MRTMSCVVVALSVTTSASSALLPDGNASLNLVVRPASYSGCADGAVLGTGVCADLSSGPSTGDSFAWVVISDGDGFQDGLTAVQFGIQHDLGAPGWTTCTDGLAIPSDEWPESGGAIAVAWPGSCGPTGVTNAPVGFFFVPGGVGQLDLVPDPRTGRVEYTDCDAIASEICANGLASVFDLSASITPVCQDETVTTPGWLSFVDTCPVTLAWTWFGSDPLVGFTLLRREGAAVDAIDIAPEDRSYTDTDVQRGRTYSYEIVARTACATSGSPTEISVDVLPPHETLQNLVASDVDCDAVNLTWVDTFTNETSVVIYRESALLATTPADVTAYTDDTAVPGEIYQYTVSAVTPCGESYPSDPDNGHRPEPFEPAQVTGLVASDDLCTVIHVTWDEVSGAISYGVRRDGEEIGEVWFDQPKTLDDTDIEIGTTYSYDVIARGRCVDAAPSSPETGISPIGSTLPPTDCAATDDFCTVRISWTDVTSYETGFTVRRDGLAIGTVPADVTVFDDDTAVVGVEHTYDVIASSPCGNSAPSNAALGTRNAPLSPSNCFATETNCAHVTVLWEDGSIDEDGFRVLRDGADVGTTSADVTSFEDATAVPGVRYDYSVVGFNACGDGVPSNTDSGAIPVLPGIPTPTSPLGTTCESSPVALQCEVVEWALTYEFEVAATCGGPPIVVREGPNPYTHATLTDPGVYVWRVRAGNACGDGDWSTCETFELATPLPAPVVDGTIAGSVVSLSWDPIPLADLYRIEVREFCDESIILETRTTTATSIDIDLEDIDGVVFGAAFDVSATYCEDVDGEATCVFVGEMLSSPIDLDALDTPRIVSVGANPARTHVRLEIGLPRSGHVRVDVFDTTGRLIRNLASEFRAAGGHGLVWDSRTTAGTIAPSGTYFVRLTMGRSSTLARVTLVR